MVHPRQNIREAIAERLKSQKTNAGDNVFTSRAKPLFDQDMPAILIYSSSETIREERWDIDGFGPLERELEIFIEAVDYGKEDLDNKLDNLAQQIENALDGWNIPKRKSAVLRFSGTDMDMSIEGQKIYGAIRLAFNLTYRTQTHQQQEFENEN